MSSPPPSSSHPPPPHTYPPPPASSSALLPHTAGAGIGRAGVLRGDCTLCPGAVRPCPHPGADDSRNPGITAGRGGHQGLPRRALCAPAASPAATSSAATPTAATPAAAALDRDHGAGHLVPVWDALRRDCADLVPISAAAVPGRSHPADQVPAVAVTASVLDRYPPRVGGGEAAGCCARPPSASACAGDAWSAAAAPPSCPSLRKGPRSRPLRRGSWACCFPRGQ